MIQYIIKQQQFFNLNPIFYILFQGSVLFQLFLFLNFFYPFYSSQKFHITNIKTTIEIAPNHHHAESVAINLLKMAKAPVMIAEIYVTTFHCFPVN